MKIFLNTFAAILLILTFTAFGYSQDTQIKLDEDLHLVLGEDLAKKFVTLRTEILIYTEREAPTAGVLPQRIEDWRPREKPKALDKCALHRVYLNPRYEVDSIGKILEPAFVDLTLKSQVSDRWYFEKEKQRRLNVVADKQEFDLGTMEISKRWSDNNYPSSDGIGNCPMNFEMLNIKIPAATYLKIVESKKVRIKIGKLSVRFNSEKDLAILRKLAMELKK